MLYISRPDHSIVLALCRQQHTHGEYTLSREEFYKICVPVNGTCICNVSIADI